jgi:hypothetical protein
MKKILVIGGLILLFAFVTSVSAVKAATCHDGMVSYWKFDEGSGSTAADSIGTDNGQLIGDGLTWTAGKVGDALQFGSASWVSMSDNGFPTGSNPRTLEAWIKTSDPGVGAIFRYGPYPLNDATFYVGKNWGGNNIWTSQWGQSVITSGANVLDGNWHHVAVTLSSGELYKIYVDGALKGSGSMPTNTILSGVSTIGSYGVPHYPVPPAADQFIGQIDEVAIYNRALTAEEIQQEYQHGLAGEGYCDFPPVIAAHEDIVAEATSPEGAVVNYALPIVTDDRDESITVTCTPVSGSTFTLGDTTVSCSATDVSGNHAIDTTFKVTVNDTTPPVITSHADVISEATSPSGATVTYILPTATDNYDSSVTVICDPTSGSIFALGVTIVTCKAEDTAGNHAIDTTFKVTVNYNWNGFFQPVDNLPILNLVKAGSAIPVKFSLNGNMGLNIFAGDYPKSTNISCNAEAPMDDLELTVTAGGSSLTYNPVANQYIYVWKTDRAWTGCRQLMVKLNDGTTKYANFKFK